MGRKEGDEEIRWHARVEAEDMADRVRALIVDEPDRRAQIWARLVLGGESNVDIGREFGYRNGSGVLQVVKRLVRVARDGQALARKLDKLRKDLSSVEN